MLKLFKYLRQSIIPILAIVVLLVIQAGCDLALPDYTSKIVNIGIQKSGIQETIPKVIRESELDKLFIFMGADEQETVRNSYKKIGKENYSEKEYNNLIKTYKVAKSISVFKLSETDKDKITELEQIMVKPMVMVSFLSTPSEQIDEMRSNMNLSPTDDLFEVFSRMPQEQLSQITSEMTGKFDEISDSILSQMSTAYVIDEYESLGLDMGKIQTNYLITVGLKMLGVALIAMLATILVCLLAAKVAAKLGMDLRGKVFKKVVSFSNAEMDKFSTASLITRSTNDIQQVQMLVVMLLRLVIYAPILGIGGVIKVVNTKTSMSWIIALAVGVIMFIVAVLVIIAMPKFNKMQSLVDRVNLVTREILTGVPVIRAFSTERHEEKRFDEANRNLTKNMLFTNRVMTFMMPLLMLVMNCITVLIIWVGAKGVDLGNLQVGDMMAFMQYTMQIVMSFLMLTMMSIMLPRAAVSAKRIDEVLTTTTEIKDPEKTDKDFNTDKLNGILKFEDVSFRYPNAEEDVLSDITFTARPGQTTAFIGSTGSGKSTLINLIPRFYDVTKGKISIDGVDIKNITQHELRSILGVVPQKGVLFSGTIESNIKYGNKEASMEEVIKAAEISQSVEFIDAKPDKYNSSISQGGGNVSGGQKQRLSIARAIAKKPKIYIFDDSFSALDYKTDIAVRKALGKETDDSTVLIVAQRISTILNADQIIVLDEGRIAGIGTHKELMKDNEIYQQIAMSQLSKEELANE